jgi:signal peptidase II
VGPRRIGFLLGTALTVLILDLVSKLIVVATLEGHPQIRLLGGFLTLLVTRNSGAAFSIGTSMTLVFSAIALGVIAVILRTSRRIRSIPWAVTLGLLLGGATGNLIDRIFRYPGLFRGYVVDWIELPHWPVFNLADSAIVCGGVLAVLLSARGIRLDASRATTDPPDGQEDPDSINKAAPATPADKPDPESAGDDGAAPGHSPRGGNSGGTGNSGGSG